tara:strand:- start:32427 stop:33590 length:1164 start_codon:yes stop_codon:yes gene_type:complete
MPWNDNTGGSGGGGGPWGAGGGNNGNGQNPWGRKPQGGGGGGQEPPDLDEVVRQLQRSFRGMFGGGGKGGGAGAGKGGGAFGIVLILVLLGVVWFALPGSGWYQVGANQAGVVLRFGEYSRTTLPGLHFKFPTPIETVFLPEVTTTNTLTIGEGNQGQMLTRDQNIVDINFAVQWRVNLDPEYPEGVRDYLFNVRYPESTVRAVAESSMREVVGTSDLQYIITEGRGEVSRRTKELLQTTLDEYQAGIEILEVNLQMAQPPASVIDAFRDVDIAEQDAERARLEATSYSNRVIPEARGSAAQMTQEAEGYRDSRIAEAQGEADRFNAIYAEYARAPQVTRHRMYFETLENVLRDSDLTILDSQSGAVPYLPLDQLGQNRTRPQGGNQ